MRKLALAGIFVLFRVAAPAQPLSELQQQKEKAAKEIEITTRLLNQVQQKEKASLSRLQLINNNINQRNTIITNLNSEIKLYQEFIQNNILAVEVLSADLGKMKEEYARLVRMTYLQRSAGNPLLFLLSAENFNQAYRRLLYMRRYTSFRNTQAATMKTLQLLLNEKAENLEKLKETRQRLLEETRSETQKLAQEKNSQNRAIQELKRQQRDLRQKLEQQRRIERQLEREIQRLIEKTGITPGTPR